MKKPTVLNVLYQSDDNYAMVSGISIASLLENNKHLDAIHIFYCDAGISAHNIQKLNTIIGRYKNVHLTFIRAEKYAAELKELNVKAWHGVYVTWLKLLALEHVEANSDRVLFINGHTIVNGPLDELIELDFGNNVMAMAYDCLLNSHKKTIGLHETDGYYNAGIILVNHKKWLDDDISGRIKRHLAKKSDYVIADQDLCNVMFRNKIKLLSSSYNYSSAYYAYNLKRLLKTNDLRPPYFYSYKELAENYYAPKIIHSLFGIKGKPWEVGNEHPQHYLWAKYLDMTPWKNADRPLAKRTLNWYLYDLMPNALFMVLYRIGVKRKFG